MITIKELSIDTESAGKIIDLIKKHEPEIWNVLKDELKEAFSLQGVVATLPNINSTEFSEWLKSELYTQTLNRLVYKRGGFEYDKDILYQHYTNQLQFGN